MFWVHTPIIRSIRSWVAAYGFVDRVFGWVVVLRAEAEACNTDTTPTQPRRISKTHQTKKSTTNVVIQQKSRKLLKMDVLMSETCWAHKERNKIASDIKFDLLFFSYHNDVRSNKHKKQNLFVCRTLCDTAV